MAPAEIRASDLSPNATVQPRSEAEGSTAVGAEQDTATSPPFCLASTHRVRPGKGTVKVGYGTLLPIGGYTGMPFQCGLMYYR